MVSLQTFRQRLAAALPGLELRDNEPMYKHTTFRVGGPVTLMALPRSVEELSTVVSLAKEAGIEPFFLGRGSNLLVADRGAEAFLIKLAGGLDRLELLGENSLYVGAGVTLAQAAVFALEHALTGLEFAHGIPGTLGGGVFMNAGAYDGELSQVISWADVLDETGRRFRLEGPDLELGPEALGGHRRPAGPDPRGPRRHPGPDGGPVPPPPEQAAPGVPQRGEHLQAAGGALRRGPHPGGRFEGGPHRRGPGQREARGLRGEHRRGHQRRYPLPHPPGPGHGPGEDRGPAGARGADAGMQAVIQ